MAGQQHRPGARKGHRERLARLREIPEFVELLAAAELVLALIDTCVPDARGASVVDRLRRAAYRAKGG